MSTFAAAGLAADDDGAFDALVRRAVDEGRAEPLDEDTTLVRWRPEGAGWLDLVVADGEVACATPQWSATHRRAVTVRDLLLDPDCPWCSVLVLDVGGAPLAVQPAGTAVLGPRTGTVTEAGLVLVADELRPGGEAPDAVRGDPTAAYAHVVGTVTAAEVRRPEGGVPHVVATLDVAGVPWDLLAPAGPLPEVGTRVAAGCWVCGEVGYPGGAGPGGVERRRERRWNWRR